MPEPNFNLHEIMITMLATQRVDYMDYDDKVCPVHFLFFHSIFSSFQSIEWTWKKVAESQ